MWFFWFLVFISIIQVNLDQLESIFGKILLEAIISVDLVFLSLGFIATPVLIPTVLFGIPAESIIVASDEEEVQVH